MRVDVSFKHMNSSAYLDNIIEKDIEKIKKRVKIFKRDDPIHLSLHIEKNPNKEQYLSWANLYLPRKVLKAQQNAPEASLGVNKVTSALIRQIDKYKVMVERHLQKSKARLTTDEDMLIY